MICGGHKCIVRNCRGQFLNYGISLANDTVVRDCVFDAVWAARGTTAGDNPEIKYLSVLTNGGDAAVVEDCQSDSDTFCDCKLPELPFQLREHRYVCRVESHQRSARTLPWRIYQGLHVLRLGRLWVLRDCRPAPRRDAVRWPIFRVQVHGSVLRGVREHAPRYDRCVHNAIRSMPDPVDGVHKLRHEICGGYLSARRVPER